MTESWETLGHFTKLGELRHRKKHPAKAVDKFQKQKEGKKTCFFVENDFILSSLTRLLLRVSLFCSYHILTSSVI